VTLNIKLSKNEIVEQHIRKKTHKSNVLRFWVEGGVILLYGFRLSSHCLRSSRCFPLRLIQQVVSESMVCSLDEYSLISVSKVFLTALTWGRDC